MFEASKALALQDEQQSYAEKRKHVGKVCNTFSINTSSHLCVDYIGLQFCSINTDGAISVPFFAEMKTFDSLSRIVFYVQYILNILDSQFATDALTVYGSSSCRCGFRP